MTTLIIMAAGFLLGFTVFPKKLYKTNNWLQPVLTVALIFFMGVSLGAKPDFLSGLDTLGLESLAFCVIPIAFSVLLVFLLTKYFIEKPSQKHKGDK